MLLSACWLRWYGRHGNCWFWFFTGEGHPQGGRPAAAVCLSTLTTWGQGQWKVTSITTRWRSSAMTSLTRAPCCRTVTSCCGWKRSFHILIPTEWVQKMKLYELQCCDTMCLCAITLAPHVIGWHLHSLAPGRYGSNILGINFESLYTE